MNFTIEKAPAFTLENKNVLKIKNPFVLGIYAFIEMEMYQGEYTISVIIDKMKKHFSIKKTEIMESLKIIIDELKLISMKEN